MTLKSSFSIRSYYPVLVLFSGCMLTPAQHSARLHSTDERNMTVGLVQKEIRKGMSQADVATVLGAPNLVTKTGGANDAWVYDRIATEASYSNSSGKASAGIGGGGTPSDSLILGILTGSTAQNSGASATTQRTLTVVIRFDSAGRVNDFSYHSSSF